MIRRTVSCNHDLAVSIDSWTSRTVQLRILAYLFKLLIGQHFNFSLCTRGLLLLLLLLNHCSTSTCCPLCVVSRADVLPLSNRAMPARPTLSHGLLPLALARCLW